jgi:hypothetical protein
MEYITAQEAIDAETKDVETSDRNSSGRKSDMYSRDRSSDQLLAIVGEICHKICDYRNFKVDLLSIETYISLQLITLPGEQQGTAKAIFSAYDDTVTDKISAVYDDTIEESKPKNMLSFLDTEEVPGKAFDTVVMSKQAPITSQTDTWTIMAAECS